jgi:hypothetical protein
VGSSALRALWPHLIQIIAPARELVLKTRMLSVSRTKRGSPMISHTHQNLTEAQSHDFGRVGGYALVAIIAILLLVALLTNPALPQ